MATRLPRLSSAPSVATGPGSVSVRLSGRRHPTATNTACPPG
ncbi:hypothetical protein [Streptomyces sp. 8L]|nr:hypothetical protein [Streptomyces sp. 8L]